MSVINHPKKVWNVQENPSLSIFRFSWNYMSRSSAWHQSEKIHGKFVVIHEHQINWREKVTVKAIQSAPILWCEFRTLDMWSQKPEQRFWRALRGCFVAAQLHKALFTSVLPWCFIWVDIFKDSEYPSRGRTLYGLIVIQEGNKVLRISPSLG